MEGISSEIKERVFATADQLYADGGQDRLPTVDAVRRAARVDMNSASALMKEWRKQQTAPAVVAVSVPEGVQQAFSGALAAAWSEAQRLANEQLEAQKAGFEAEKLEAEALRAELSEAFEAQEKELEQVQDQLQRQHQELTLERQASEDARDELQDVRRQLDAVTLQNATLNERCDGLAERLQVAEKQSEKYESEARKAADALDQERIKAQELAGQVRDFKAEAGQLRAEVNELKKALDSAQVQAAADKEAADLAVADKQAADKEAAEVKAQAAADKAAAEKEIAVLQAQLNAANEFKQLLEQQQKKPAAKRTRTKTQTTKAADSTD